MRNKIIIFFFLISLTFPSVVNGEYKISRNYLKLAEVSSDDSESIEIKNTEITNKEKAKELLVEINNRDQYNQIKNAGTLKFKGSAEEIYNEYANSVVLIGNRKNWSNGSGFFIKHDGLKIITNWHVVDGTRTVDIWFKPKETKEVDYILNNIDSYKGKVIKTNKEKDLAMIELKVKGISKKIKPVKFGSYKNVKIGEMGFAIGHPEGYGWTFTGDMVSQIRPNYKWKYDDSRHYASVIQIQTPIHQGNSGGPLFNKNKELIGVNTFTTAKNETLNFAVSVDDLIKFINEDQQQIEIESEYIKKKPKDSTWIKKRKKRKNGKSSSNSISKKYPNANKVDSNKNGITDMWFVDENNNGKVDTIIMDINENQIVDGVGFDENENENFETIVYDDDENGYPDRADFDKDDNGSSDIIAYDYNQDGEWDKYETVG